MNECTSLLILYSRVAQAFKYRGMQCQPASAGPWQVAYMKGYNQPQTGTASRNCCSLLLPLRMLLVQRRGAAQALQLAALLQQADLLPLVLQPPRRSSLRRRDVGKSAPRRACSLQASRTTGHVVH